MRNWSPLFGVLGAIFIAFGLISLVVWQLGAPTDLRWIYGNFGLGVLLLVSALVGGLDMWRERLSTGEARRVQKYGTSAVVSTILGVVILGMLGFMSTRYTKRFDWSEAKALSLSDQTVKVIEGLERDVELLAFYPALVAGSIRDLLDRYAYVSDRVKVEVVDPQVRRDLLERYAISDDQLGQGLIRVAIGEEAVQVTEPNESELTNAIVKLTRTGDKKVYFLEGHGERPISDGPKGQSPQGGAAIIENGYSKAAKALENENYRLESIVLGVVGEVPDDADVVVIAGPTQALRPAETRALENYVNRGGSVLALVDPRANTDLYGLLDQWGVVLGDDVILDELQGLFGQPHAATAGEYAGHPITQDLREVTLFVMARSVGAKAGGGGDFTEIVKTSKNSWAERNLDLFVQQGKFGFEPDDTRGPIPVAIAGTPAHEAVEEGATPKLVVFGDSDFASNQAIDAYRNRDLFINSVNWLLGDVEAISIRPPVSRASRLRLSSQELSNIRYLSLFILPEAIAILGAVSWWGRRHSR